MPRVWESTSLGLHSMPALGEDWGAHSGGCPAQGGTQVVLLSDHGMVKLSRAPGLGGAHGQLPAVSTEAASCPFFLAVTNLPLDARSVIRRSRHSMSK